MPTASPIEHDILATTDNGRPNDHLVGPNGVARIFFGGGPIFRDLRRPTRFGGGEGSSRHFQ